jgi:hypothetical protein
MPTLDGAASHALLKWSWFNFVSPELHSHSHWMPGPIPHKLLLRPTGSSRSISTRSLLGTSYASLRRGSAHWKTAAITRQSMKIRKNEDIHGPSRIRTHVRDVRAANDRPHLKPSCHCYTFSLNTILCTITTGAREDVNDPHAWNKKHNLLLQKWIGSPILRTLRYEFQNSSICLGKSSCVPTNQPNSCRGIE